MIRAIEPIQAAGDREPRPSWSKRTRIPEGFGDLLIQTLKEDQAMSRIEALEAACQAMAFSFDEVAKLQGYEEALRRFCLAKRLAAMALSVAP